MKTEIGSRIRTLRKRQGRTLQEVADACGFTRSLLCKIEKGSTTPPIATLTKIAASLGTRMTSLLGDGDGRRPLFIPSGLSADKGLTRTAKGYRFHAFAADWPEKSMQPYLFTARKKELRPGPLSHPGEEFVFLLEGAMRYRVGVVEHLLKAGDALYFDSSEEHDLTPVSEEVRYLAVFTEAASGPIKKGRS